MRVKVVFSDASCLFCKAKPCLLEGTFPEEDSSGQV